MTTRDTRTPATATAVSAVPAATALFWVTKILTTGMGETTSDYLVTRFEPVLVVGLAGIAFLAALAVALRPHRYVPWSYWLAVVMVSVFGTMAADVTHVVLGVPYLVSTVVFAVVLAAVFVAWRRTEGTLSIHDVTTRRRELFYWATVLGTFALGTALGDMTAVTLHLGYLASGVLFAVVIAVPALAHRAGRLGPVAAFWSAYVVTRPLGASVADWMGVPPARGGLGWGTGPVSLVLGVVIVALVVVLSRRDREARPGPVPAAR